MDSKVSSIAQKRKLMICQSNEESRHAGAATVLGDSSATIIAGAIAHIYGRQCCWLEGGPFSVLVGGPGSVLLGGRGSVLCFERHDRVADRYRLVVAYVGENGILPNIPYCLAESGEVIPYEEGD